MALDETKRPRPKPADPDIADPDRAGDGGRAVAAAQAKPFDGPPAPSTSGNDRGGAPGATRNDTARDVASKPGDEPGDGADDGRQLPLDGDVTTALPLPMNTLESLPTTRMPALPGPSWERGDIEFRTPPGPAGGYRRGGSANGDSGGGWSGPIRSSSQFGPPGEGWSAPPGSWYPPGGQPPYDPASGQWASNVGYLLPPLPGPAGPPDKRRGLSNRMLTWMLVGVLALGGGLLLWANRSTSDAVPPIAPDVSSAVSSVEAPLPPPPAVPPSTTSSPPPAPAAVAPVRPTPRPTPRLTRRPTPTVRVVPRTTVPRTTRTSRAPSSSQRTDSSRAPGEGDSADDTNN